MTVRARALALVTCLLVFAGAMPAASGSARFSQGLKAPERAEAGIDRLSSDQIAVLDALVRRDAAGPARREGAAETSFSQRLTDDERRTAGLPTLNAAEVARIDSLVARHHSAGLAHTLLGPIGYASRPSPLRPEDTAVKAERKIHGTLTLSYGVGKGGYSERSASMVLRHDDPAGRYSISVGYGESRVTGGDTVFVPGPPP